jgi:hypothetical protein
LKRKYRLKKLIKIRLISQKEKIFRKKTINIEEISQNKERLQNVTYLMECFFNNKAVSARIPGNVNIPSPVNLKKKKNIIK